MLWRTNENRAENYSCVRANAQQKLEFDLNNSVIDGDENITSRYFDIH